MGTAQQHLPQPGNIREVARKIGRRPKSGAPLGFVILAQGLGPPFFYLSPIQQWLFKAPQIPPTVDDADDLNSLDRSLIGIGVSFVKDQV